MKKENNGSRPLREELNSSAVSEQNAAASSELANQAQILKELTEHFQVRKGTCCFYIDFNEYDSIGENV